MAKKRSKEGAREPLGLRKDLTATEVAEITKSLRILHSEFVPPLHPQDVVGLLALAVTVRLIQERPPPGQVLWTEYRAEYESVALMRVIEAIPRYASGAGIIDRPENLVAAGAQVEAWWREWNEKVVNPLLIGNQEGWDCHEYVLWRLWLRTFGALLPTDNTLLQDAAEGVKLSKKEHREKKKKARSGDKSSPDEFEHEEEGVSEHFLQTAKGPANLYWIDDKGLRIRKLALRDGRGRASRIEQDMNKGGDALDAESPSVQGDELHQVEIADEASQAMKAVEAICHAAAETARPGSPRRVVIDNARALLQGEKTVVDLANETGLNRRTLASAWGKLRAEIEAECRRRDEEQGT